MEKPKRIVGDDGELLFEDEDAYHTDNYNGYSFSYYPITAPSLDVPRPSFWSRRITMDGWALFTISALIAFMILLLLFNSLVVRFEDRHGGADPLPTQAPSCSSYEVYLRICRQRY